MDSPPYEKIVTFFSSRKCAGIENTGNTCYISTSLICLAHCLYFAYPVIANKAPDSNIVSAMRDLYTKMWIKQAVASPAELIASLTRISEIIDMSEQNDAMEFIMLLMDTLNTEYGDPVPKRERKQGLAGKAKFIDIMDTNWVNTHHPKKSFLCNVLYGQAVNQTKCSLCGSIEHQGDVFCNISLDMSSQTNSAAPPLRKLIDTYFEQESVQRECDSCKLRNVTGSKVTRIWRSPQVLIIHFKRFDHRNRKRGDAIEVPPNLDMDDYTISQHAITKYELKAIACHAGDTNFGHYFAVVKNPSGQWFIMDDDAPPKEIQDYTQVNPSQFYMLFYEAM